ncbi:uncharacterized protein HaLaN_09508 [Haematococcus lacustris]|uniref:Uncharacterized protein n=1 Tax=Haematococcus lacustris TaxID=44745 RepID=A0A699Z293_HAELA|nr:uncharacterized protein HaLaN_09508 [Haematococcus lacustris]
MALAQSFHHIVVSGVVVLGDMFRQTCPHSINSSYSTARLDCMGEYYVNREDTDEDGNAKPWLQRSDDDTAYRHYKELKAAEPPHPLIERVANRANKVLTKWELGYCTGTPPMRNDGTWEKLDELPGCNGTPPMVYGVVWNPWSTAVRSSPAAPWPSTLSLHCSRTH